MIACLGLSHGDLPGVLGSRWSGWSASAQRRAAAGRKLSIYGEAHLPLVKAEIGAMLGKGQIAEDIGRFAQRSPNVLKAVADAIAVAYRRGCTRSLVGATPEQERAFADIVTECGITRKAPGINSRSWVSGPQWVSPYISSRGQVALDVIGSNRLDADMRGEDVERVLWQVGGSFVLLDADAWTYYDEHGEETGRVPGEPARIPHAVGRAPVVPFVCYDGGDDWWCSTAHDGLADATLMCAYKLALGLYTRQVNSKPQLVLAGVSVADMPKGQVLGHPVQPLVLPDGVATVLDLTVDPSQYLSEISAILTMAISAEGLPPGSVTLTSYDGSLGIVAEGPRLAAHRDRQVPWLRQAEHELWPLVCDLVRGSTHKHARVLPSGDEVRDMLRVVHPDLSSAAERREEIEVMKLGLPYGLSSPVDVPLAARPELTRAEVDEMQRQNLADYIDRIEPLVSRNISGKAPDALGHQSIAQQQGRTGGIASGETRASQAQEKNQ